MSEAVPSPVAGEVPTPIAGEDGWVLVSTTGDKCHAIQRYAALRLTWDGGKETIHLMGKLSLLWQTGTKKFELQMATVEVDGLPEETTIGVPLPPDGNYRIYNRKLQSENAKTRVIMLSFEIGVRGFETAQITLPFSDPNGALEKTFGSAIEKAQVYCSAP